jgi:hypothetical protein
MRIDVLIRGFDAVSNVSTVSELDDPHREGSQGRKYRHFVEEVSIIELASIFLLRKSNDEIWSENTAVPRNRSN